MPQTWTNAAPATEHAGVRHIDLDDCVTAALPNSAKIGRLAEVYFNEPMTALGRISKSGISRFRHQRGFCPAICADKRP
jgi:hypothetical protein